MISSLNPVPSLPQYPGPHKVGTVEFEIPVSEIDTGSPVPNPQINTVKFRLFYPTPSTSTAKQSLPWLPRPQNQWTEAYASFLGASPSWSKFISRLPSLISYTTIPAVNDAPLLPSTSGTGYPLVIFSHGLGGNFNTYSSVCGSLASHGVICAAPEHRDGSSPISFIRSADGNSSVSIPYQKHSHSPTVEVLNARNSQLRVRLWEFELLYSALSALNDGRSVSNYATPNTKEMLPSFRNAMDMTAGKVTWSGHSFGAASIVQFIKSVFYYQSLPSLHNTPYEHDPGWQPLYVPRANGKVIEQITSSSPIALLDVWTLPLRGDSTRWLWEKPLPCYARPPATCKAPSPAPNTVAIISSEFYNWKDLRNRTRALLSPDPVEAIVQIEGKAEMFTSSISQSDSGLLPPATALATHLSKASSDDESVSSAPSSQLSKPSTPSGSPSRTSSPASIATSTTSATSALSLSSSASPSRSTTAPQLFTIANSAHLSQSDFGVLFPNLTRYFMKAQEPEETLTLNVRAVLAVMRGQGLRLDWGEQTAEEDQILGGRGDVKRFVSVSLVD